MTIAIPDYRQQVKDAALKRSGEPLYNGSLDHASVLAAAMFEHAKSDVCILTGKLNAHVYAKPDVIQRARLFLATPGHTVKVLLENPDEIDAEDHPFVKVFGGKDDVTFKHADILKELPYHFMVMDGDCYRFEEDKHKPSAIAAFGDSRGGSNLRTVFNDLWEQAGEPLFRPL